MARAKKTPDYLNLPFEVYFKRMSVYGYELIHEIGKNPKNPDSGAIIAHQVRLNMVQQRLTQLLKLYYFLKE